MILAEQHAGISASDVNGWLPRQPDWPKPGEWVRERLVHVATDLQLITGADAVIAKYEGLLIPETDRALVHTDVGFHNMAIDPASLKVCGLFDYEGAAWADRHHDFRYLIFDLAKLGRFEVLDAAISVYEAALNRRIERRRIFLYNAACAITFLADRAGTGPEERPCGRTLAEDLRWRNARLQQRWILGWELGRARSRLSMDAFRGLDWHDRAPAETVIRQSMIVGAKASAKVGS